MNGYEFSEKETYDLIKQGNYEVTLDTAEIRSFKSDATKKYLSLKFVIRRDVEQPHIGRSIFESVFRDKENPSQFDHRKLQRIILTQKDKPTFQKTFANEDELIQYLNGLNMQITISEKEPDAYHDTEYNEVAYLSYRPSNIKFQTLGETSPSVSQPQKVNINDYSDELPF